MQLVALGTKSKGENKKEERILTLHFREPLWLSVMLGGAGHCVEKHQQKHQPVEVSGLDGHTAVLPHCVIQLAQLVTKKRVETAFLNSLQTASHSS